MESKIQRLEYMLSAKRLNVSVATIREIVRKIEQIFDLSYLFSHHQLYQMIKQHPKGYVKYDILFEQEPLKKWLAYEQHYVHSVREEIGAQNFKIACNQGIRQLSQKLWATPLGVKRVAPYSADSFQPVFLELMEEEHIEQMEALFSKEVQICNVEYYPKQNWGLVWASQPQKLKQFDGKRFQENGMQLRVQVEEAYRVIERTFEARQNLKHLSYQSSQMEMYPCLKCLYKEGNQIDKKTANAFMIENKLERSIVLDLSLDSDQDQQQQMEVEHRLNRDFSNLNTH